VVPQRGPLIDMYGPGTVFYRARMREESMRKKRTKQGFRGANFGLTIPVTQLVPENALVPTETYNVNKSGEIQICEVSRNSAHESVSDEDYNYERKGVNIMDKTVHPYGSSFVDYRSSDRALTVLEERIKHWHSTFTSAKHRKSAKSGSVKLERVKINVSTMLIWSTKLCCVCDILGAQR
jgi:hypothetical protein